MPVIELPDEPPRGTDTYGVSILAVMLFPHARQAKERQNWQAAAMAYAYHYWRTQGAPWQFLVGFHGWLGDLWEISQSPQRVFYDGFARVKRARLSAHILDNLLRLARHHPAHCKLEQAKALAREELGEAGTSDSTLNKVWADFRVVSHLWMAYLERKHEGGKIGTNEDWLETLAAGEAYRKEAENLRLLQPIGNAWRAPESLALPPIEELDIPPLQAKFLEFLAREFPV